MTLYHETTPGTFDTWNGEVIEFEGMPVRYPLNIEAIESDEWLAARGLYKLTDPGIPDDKIEMSRSLQLINGILTIVYVTRDKGPADCNITMRQLRLGLKDFAGKRANYIQGIIDDIVDPAEQDAAQIWYDETTEVEWENPMTVYFISKTEFTVEQAAGLWMLAYQNLPR